MNKYQKGFAPIIIVLIVLFLAGAGGTSYYLINKQFTEQITCTMDAKICPDGLLVGRTGPNCEFVACPEAKIDETANLKIYKNENFGFEIKYPDNIAFEETSYGIKFVPKGEEKYIEQSHSAIFLLIRPEKVNQQESLESLIKNRFNLKELDVTPWTSDMGIDMIESFVFVNNKSGYLIHQWTQAYGECHYFLQQKDVLIDIYMGEIGLISSSCKNNSVFNQMFSTFRFMGESQ